MMTPFLPAGSKRGGQRSLYCLPYAGAGASRYYRWASWLPPDIEVCPILLPGREGRVAEHPFTRMDELVFALADALALDISGPFAVFGHSMGALIGFELVRLLCRKWGARPVCLFASGYRAPQLPSTRPMLHDLSDREFIARVRQFQNTPDDPLLHDEYMQLMLPTLRADFELCETYTYRSGAPLECRISAFGGAHDATVATADLEAWAVQTRGTFSLRTFPGGHLFLNECEGEVIRSIVEDLRCEFAANRV